MVAGFWEEGKSEGNEGMDSPAALAAATVRSSASIRW